MDLTDWRFKLYSQFWKTIDNIFPPVCIGCGKADESFCVECKQEISKITYTNNRSKRGKQVSKSRGNYSIEEDIFFTARAYSYHEGVMKEAVHRLKYESDLGLGKILAKELTQIVEENNWKADVVVPIPLGKKRKKERGYNQAEVIGFPLAYYLNIDFDPKMIRRCKETRTQIGLSVKERFENVHQAFVVENGRAIGKSILLVDDVYTSGATMMSAADSLKDAGAKSVYSLTVTRANDFSDQEIW